jgi:hypothetical protein
MYRDRAIWAEEVGRSLVVNMLEKPRVETRLGFKNPTMFGT